MFLAALSSAIRTGPGVPLGRGLSCRVQPPPPPPFARLAVRQPGGGTRCGSIVPPQPRAMCLSTLSSASSLNGTNAHYLDDLYQQWVADPSSVDASWTPYFEQLANTVGSSLAAPRPGSGAGGSGLGAGTEVSSAALRDAVRDHMKVLQLMRAYQVSGHLKADIDPLGFDRCTGHLETSAPELELAYYGFTEADLSREFFIGTGVATGLLAAGGTGIFTLAQIIASLKATYCGHIGYEFMHIQSREVCNFIRERIERPRELLDRDQALLLLDRLVWATKLEEFLAVKFGKGEKRFGLEGCEALIPGFKEMIDYGAELGIQSYVIGMPHRGRLSVLANVLRKPLVNIFAEFAGFTGQAYGSGDVKYHLGMAVERPTRSGKPVYLSLVPNPSHLEAVNPVVEGKTRAKQFYMGDTERKRVVSVLLHGDASFAGQGVVLETMGFSELHDYTTGGTIHVIVNNQIGFTADPRHSRSSPYCTDLAKFVGAPIFHVNADFPEEVMRVFRQAIEFRQRWSKSVVIDVVCYRRHGHNEGDEPKFTQPLMYSRIEKHPNTLKLYTDFLLRTNRATQPEIDAIVDRCHQHLEAAFLKAKELGAKSGSVEGNEWLQGGDWMGLKAPYQISPTRWTGVSETLFKKVGSALATYPADFNIHKGLARVMAEKREMIQSGEGIDWGTAEALAFGTLLCEGYHVRLSGQDVERGTFSHRHSVLIDQQTEAHYVPLNNIDPGRQNVFSVSNSSLSEFGVLGFELGYAQENPRSLVVWEAQFGDFANGAQIIIDQFISAAEVKWLRQSGLVMLLPHGYEGAGPEHSSARLERFLQLTDEDPDTWPADATTDDPSADQRTAQIQRCNMQVVVPSTPSNLFHVLRRQLHRDFRKPLVVITPKSLLRMKASPELPVAPVSSASEFLGDRRYRMVIGETQTHLVADDKVRRVILCSGKVYYDLIRKRTQLQNNDVAIVRVEQLAPFPFIHVAKHSTLKYPNAEVVWVQEEPKNMGSWSHVQPRIATVLAGPQGTSGDRRRVRYVGRPVAASPATGFKNTHYLEQKELLAEAFA